MASCCSRSSSRAPRLAAGRARGDRGPDDRRGQARQSGQARGAAHYRQGIEIAPDFVALRSNYGLSLAISEQSQEAIAQLAPLAASRGADGRVRQNLAFAYAMNGDLENCLKVSRRDLDEVSAQRQLQYFIQLKNLPVAARSAELRRNPNFFPQSATSG